MDGGDATRRRFQGQIGRESISTATPPQHCYTRLFLMDASPIASLIWVAFSAPEWDEQSIEGVRILSHKVESDPQ